MLLEIVIRSIEKEITGKSMRLSFFLLAFSASLVFFLESACKRASGSNAKDKAVV